MAHNIELLVVTLKFTCTDRELNSTPFGRLRILNLSLVFAKIVLPISPISHTSDSVKLLSLILLFQLVIIILNQVVESYSIVSTCDN